MEVIYTPGARITDEISALSSIGYIRRDGNQFVLTQIGNDYLYKLSGGKKPKMIDLDETALMHDKKRRKFVVRSSLAEEFLREVRNGN